MIAKSIKTTKIALYNIIGDGIVSITGIGEGRFIPSLILDAELDSELDHLIRIHQSTPSGDAIYIWTIPLSLFSPKSLNLEVSFVKPMQVDFAIKFNINKQFALIDGIVQSRSAYLQIGVSGDNVSDGSKNKILIEVPECGFDKTWDKMLHKIVKSKLSGNNRTKNQINQQVSEQIKAMRSLMNIRR